MVAALAAGALLCGSAAPAQADSFPSRPATGLPSVTVAVLPSSVDMRDLAGVRGMALGQLSAEIGDEPPEQVLLDITQGSRVNEALYDGELPAQVPFGTQVPEWARIVERAGGAPADLIPGLLASRLLDAGVPVQAEPKMNPVALIAADRSGAVRRSARPGCSYQRRCRGLVVLSANIHKLKGLAYGLPEFRGSPTEGIQGNDLLIAITMPDSDGSSAIGIAAPGYYHDLRADWTQALVSDSTRTDGYVLSTDIAPTVLTRFGVSIPDEIDGEPIRPGAADSRPSVVQRADRLAAIPDRRGTVVVLCLLGWILVAALLRREWRKQAAAWVALAFAYMPLLLLAGAAARPSAVGEAALVLFGAGVLAIATLRLARGWLALATACAITVGAYAVDMFTGSDLTRLSLLGPNPLYGVRFYGIGNELEALLAVMVPVGTGAALTWRWRSGAPVTDGQATAIFLGAAVVGAAIFATGRFGADVGAAIVLPVGGAVAAATLPRAEIGERSLSTGRRVALSLVAAPLVGLAALALIDLISGANAHLTRSVLDAGGAGDLADVAQRRLRLSANDFAQAAGNPLFWALVAGLTAATLQWRRIDAWLRAAPLARAGFFGACAALAVGVLVNDSGATFLVLGSCALGASVAYAWSQA